MWSCLLTHSVVKRANRVRELQEQVGQNTFFQAEPQRYPAAPRAQAGRRSVAWAASAGLSQGRHRLHSLEPSLHTSPFQVPESAHRFILTDQSGPKRLSCWGADGRIAVVGMLSGSGGTFAVGWVERNRETLLNPCNDGGSRDYARPNLYAAAELRTIRMVKGNLMNANTLSRRTFLRQRRRRDGVAVAITPCCLPTLEGHADRPAAAAGGH